MSWEDLRGPLKLREQYDRLAAMARDGDTFVQIGVSWGKGIAYLARHLIDAHKAVRLVGVDPWMPNPPGTGATGDSDDQPWIREHGGRYSAFVADMRRHAPEELEYIQTWRMSSAEAARVFLPASCSAVVIGEHEYKDVRDNIMRWLPVVESGGLLLGGDYSPLHPGAMKAVWEAFAHSSYSVHGSSWVVELKGERPHARVRPRPRALPAQRIGVRLAPRPVGKDDTPTVQAAIDNVSKVRGTGAAAGGTVVFTPGNFQLQGAIVASGGGIVLTTGGARGGATVLRAPDTSTSPEPSDPKRGPPGSR
jgi:Methyltransferase domain